MQLCGAVGGGYHRLVLRVIEVSAAGMVVAGGDELARKHDAGVLRWIDVQGQTIAEMEKLKNEFGLHPLAVEDCLSFDQRPKVNDYPEHLFLVIHGFTCPSGDPSEVEIHELHCFLLDRTVITVHERAIPALEDVYRRAERDHAFCSRGADMMLHSIVDAVVDANFPLLDLLSDALDEVEEQVLARLSRNDLTRIFTLKKTLVTMRRTLSPERDVFAILSKRGDPRISEKAALYFRDVYDHLSRIYEHIDTGRDLLGNALDAYLSSVSNRTNEIMKRLTIMSAIFLPMGFVVGFFGQNFTRLPWNALWFELSAVSLLIAIPILMVIWFYRLKWLGDH